VSWHETTKPEASRAEAVNETGCKGKSTFLPGETCRCAEVNLIERLAETAGVSRCRSTTAVEWEGPNMKQSSNLGSMEDEQEGSLSREGYCGASEVGEADRTGTEGRAVANAR